MKGPRSLLIAVALGLGAGWLRAQAADSIVAADGSPLPGGPWHAALEARAALRTPDPRPEDVRRAIDAELALGRPDRAHRVLSRHRLADPDLEPKALILDAAVAYASGSYARAGTLFAQAAARASGVTGGLLAARAGSVFDRAGQPAEAAAQYRAAASDLPEIAGWLALREARVTADTTVAFRLLDRVPPAARRLIPAVRGELLAVAGDTARAVAVLAGAGFDGRAAGLALASGDSSGARQLAYRAVRAGDTAVANLGIRMASDVFPPRTAAEFLDLGRAVRRDAPGRAAELIGQVVIAGDVSTRTLLLWGDVLAEAGDHASALEAYTRAAARPDADAEEARFNRARVLVRLGRSVAAIRALTEFAAAHPAHRSVPMATFLLAELSDGGGRRAEADSIYRVLTQRWPQHEYASQARFRLAARALTRGDTTWAAELYRAEADAGAAQQLAARYLLGALASAGGDSAAARNRWSALARDDSLGYYGSLARGRLSLPAPDVPSPAVPEASDRLARWLLQLDLLDRVGYDEEAETLVSWLAAEAAAADDALDLAEALVARRRSTRAIILGWRAARTLTLNHPRVLRAVYPWPFREVIAAEAREFGLDQYLVAAVVRQESSFDPGARSRAGAQGLMQVLPGTARQAARRLGIAEWRDDLLGVPDANLHVGASHLAALLRRYRGNVVLAVAAYNAGSVPVERWRRFPEARDPALIVERMPYPETRGYVRAVLRNLAIYRALYPSAGGP